MEKKIYNEKGRYIGTVLKNTRSTKILTNKEIMKYEIADELGLMDKVKAVGWPYLTAKEAGRIGGILTARNKKRKKLDEDFAAQNADLIKAYMDSEEN